MSKSTIKRKQTYDVPYPKYMTDHDGNVYWVTESEPTEAIVVVDASNDKAFLFPAQVVEVNHFTLFDFTAIVELSNG